MRALRIGTKRMWLRRLLRTGDVIVRAHGAIWNPTKRAVSWWWKEIGIGGTIGIGFLSGLIGCLFYAAFMTFYSDRVASNEHLMRAMKADECVAYNLPGWHKKTKNDDGPTLNGDIYSVQAACDKMHAEDAAKEEQAKVLKR